MIPKKIHYCWFGEGDIPDKDKKCIESWKKFCPEYEIIRWDESNYDIKKNEYMHEAYKQKKWGFVPDYARLDIVYTYGGIYLDTDVELMKPLEELLKFPAFCGFEAGEKENLEVNLGLGFGAEQGNPIIKEMLEQYSDLKFINNDGSLNMIPSPVYTTEILKKHNLEERDVIQDLKKIIVFPKEYFSPKSYFDGIIRCTDKTVSIHHFNASWNKPEEKQKHEYIQRYRRIFGKGVGTFLGVYAFTISTKGIIRGHRYLLNRLIKRIKNN